VDRISSVAVASRSFSKNLLLRTEILKQYKNVTFNDAGTSLKEEGLIQFLQGHDFAIIALEEINREILKNLPQLKAIGKYGVGLDKVDLAAMDEFGVKLGWSPGVNKRSVSEMVLAATIALLHRVQESNHMLRCGNWGQLVGKQLTGRNVGIIGFGNIGQDLVRLLRPFNCTIYVNDIKDVSKLAIEMGCLSVSLAELLANSEIVTVHVPFNAANQNLIDTAELKKLKRGSLLINMSRGGIVNEAAVKDLLISGYLGGAALDVFEVEPFLDFELANMPTLLATCHIGGSSEEAILSMGRAAIAGLKNAVKATNFIHY
jgi:D-3-phosphoglycerate dehydrogenase